MSDADQQRKHYRRKRNFGIFAAAAALFAGGELLYHFTGNEEETLKIIKAASPEHRPGVYPDIAINGKRYFVWIAGVTQDPLCGVMIWRKSLRIKPALASYAHKTPVYESPAGCR